MKIIVTGGAGFIGSHIVDAYIKNGHRVAIIDNLKTGFRRNVNPKAKFYRADIRNLGALRSIFKKERPTLLNHHAAIAEVAKSLRDPLPTFETNVIGTANVALLAGEMKIKKLIFASSGGAIYGDPKHIPAPETTLPMPLSPYGLSKLLGEEVIRFYANTLGFNFTFLRYANVFGPRQNPKGEAGIVAIFGKLMKSGGRPHIFGDGSKTRDYVFIEDVVRANVLALQKGNGATVNIGRGKEVSDQEMFDTIAKAANFKKPATYKPFRKGEVQNISLNWAHAKKILGWQPKVGLEEGVKKTLAVL